MQNRILALFDFDGTITFRDSLIDFLRFVFGDWTFIIGIVKSFHYILGYKLGIVSNHYAKERLFANYFKGWHITEFQLIADRYSTEKLPKILRKDAIDQIKKHKLNNDKIVIVTASIENWLYSWCKQNSVELIGTQIEVINDHLTGKFSTRNCYGIEKVKRAKAKYIFEKFEDIFVYGDSKGDRELMKIATKSFYKVFKSNILE